MVNFHFLQNKVAAKSGPALWKCSPHMWPLSMCTTKHEANFVVTLNPYRSWDCRSRRDLTPTITSRNGKDLMSTYRHIVLPTPR
jgi:hypothetical protein